MKKNMMAEHSNSQYGLNQINSGGDVQQSSDSNLNNNGQGEGGNTGSGTNNHNRSGTYQIEE